MTPQGFQASLAAAEFGEQSGSYCREALQAARLPPIDRSPRKQDTKAAAATGMNNLPRVAIQSTSAQARKKVQVIQLGLVFRL